MNITTLRRLSHDVRGSVANLRMGLEACCQSPALLTQLGPAMLEELNRLDRRLQQLNWLARCEHASAQLHDVPSLVAGWCADRGLSLTECPPFQARLDPDLMRAAFIEICENAQTHAGGVRQVRIDFTEDRWQLEVLDHGPGWPTGLASWLEQPQLWNGQIALGLPLVQKVLSQHGGKLLLEKAPACWSAARGKF